MPFSFLNPGLRGAPSFNLQLVLVGLLGLGACSADKDPPALSDDVNNAGEDSDDDGDSSKKADAGSAKPDARSTSDEGKKRDGAAPPIVPDDGENKCAGIRTDAPPAAGVDIIFLIDTSGSMLHATMQVQANIAKFVQDFEGSAADTRVVMITGTDPAAGNPLAMETDKYRFISSEVDSGALFAVALARFPEYQDFLRPGSAVQFVMITDDQDRVPPPTFAQQMKELLSGREFIQHAVASPAENGLPCISKAQLWNPLCVAPIPAICGAAAIGEAYYTLADDTGGEKLSICEDDWSGVFLKLKEAVIAAVPLPCNYPLAAASTDTFDTEEVAIVYTPASGKDQEFPRASDEAQCGDKVGWHYDDPAKPTTVVLCPKACEAVAAGGSVDIAFGCKPTILI